MSRTEPVACAVCGKSHDRAVLRPISSLSAGLTAEVQRETPGLAGDALICRADVARFRRLYLERLLEAERGQISRLDRDVLASLEAEVPISADPERDDAGPRSFGQRAADAVAAFGGSWHFILIFLAVLMVWMAVNSIALYRPYDPYPCILLNLVLSCIAALQAPIIMMSQRRQEAKDRIRAENDYRVNLKAELEIRALHDKIDHQMARQWERLAAIQQMQIELMEEAAQTAPGGRPG